MELREALNAVSDVIVNRPAPIREFDQIYMKAADMLLQAEHVSRWLDGRRTVFIGDGDAISLCLVHLRDRGHFAVGPSQVLVLDFDERIVNAVNRFANRNRLSQIISAVRYNVADALPSELWGVYDAFYTNPPFGESNGGTSIDAFVTRGLEATARGAIGCLVLADSPSLAWTQAVLRNVQTRALEADCVIAEMIPELHRYHLDDAPELTSCSLVLRRLGDPARAYHSRPLTEEQRSAFYGSDTPLTVRYVRDLGGGGRFPTRDYELVPFEA